MLFVAPATARVPRYHWYVTVSGAGPVMPVPIAVRVAGPVTATVTVSWSFQPSRVLVPTGSVAALVAIAGRTPSTDAVTRTVSAFPRSAVTGVLTAAVQSGAGMATPPRYHW